MLPTSQKRIWRGVRTKKPSRADRSLKSGEADRGAARGSDHVHRVGHLEDDIQHTKCQNHSTYNQNSSAVLVGLIQEHQAHQVSSSMWAPQTASPKELRSRTLPSSTSWSTAPVDSFCVSQQVGRTVAGLPRAERTRRPAASSLGHLKLDYPPLRGLRCATQTEWSRYEIMSLSS